MTTFLARALLIGASLGLLLVPSARAQDSDPPMDRRTEARLLREATAREAVGDYRGAEHALRMLLDRKATSAGGLFALERVLRAQGRAVETLDAVDAFLEEEPEAPEPNVLKLRLLAEADSLEALKAAGEAWISAAPSSEDAYRQIARTFEGAFGAERALDVLRRGRRALGDSASLAVELGQALIETGEVDEAVREWSLALGSEAARASTVLRRMMALQEARTQVAEGLARRLGTEPTTLARRRAGARLAVAAGLEEAALELARSVAPELSERARRGFLAELAARAEGSGSEGVALWAYRKAREEVQDPEEARHLDERISRAALSVGDTAVALAARDRLADSHPEGSEQRRRALAAAARLQVGGGDLAGARERLAALRDEYPDARELDELAALLSARLLAREQTEDARVVLEGVEGPRSSLERGYLALGRGDVASALEELSGALSGLEPREATEVIQLLALLERLDEASGELVGRVVALKHAGRVDEALKTLDDGFSSVEPENRPGLLALGARLAREGSREARAAAFRERLITGFPEAPETPEAMLRQARWHADAGRGPARARELLERLIVERPESPVVPEARRELERLRRGSAG